MRLDGAARAAYLQRIGASRPELLAELESLLAESPADSLPDMPAMETGDASQECRLIGRRLYRCHSGMIHLFYGMGAMIPYASAAFELIGSDIRSMLQRTNARGRG